MHGNVAEQTRDGTLPGGSFCDSASVPLRRRSQSTDYIRSVFPTTNYKLLTSNF